MGWAERTADSLQWVRVPDRICLSQASPSEALSPSGPPGSGP